MRRLIPVMQRVLAFLEAEFTRTQVDCLFAAANAPPEKRIIIPEIQLADDNFLCKVIDQSSLDWITGPDFQNFRVSPDLIDYTGYPASKFRGSSWIELVHPKDLDRVLANYQQSCEAQTSFCITYRMRRRKDRQYGRVVDQGVPRYRRDGSFAGHIGKVELPSISHARSRVSNG
jgi:hypothetical protein